LLLPIDLETTLRMEAQHQQMLLRLQQEEQQHHYNQAMHGQQPQPHTPPHHNISHAGSNDNLSHIMQHGLFPGVSDAAAGHHHQQLQQHHHQNNSVGPSSVRSLTPPPAPANGSTVVHAALFGTQHAQQHGQGSVVSSVFAPTLSNNNSHQHGNNSASSVVSASVSGQVSASVTAGYSHQSSVGGGVGGGVAGSRSMQAMRSGERGPSDHPNPNPLSASATSAGPGTAAGNGTGNGHGNGNGTGSLPAAPSNMNLKHQGKVIYMDKAQLLQQAAQRALFSLAEIGSRKRRQIQAKAVVPISEQDLAVLDSSAVLERDQAQNLLFSLPFFTKPPSCRLIYSTQQHYRSLEELLSKTQKV
jgi:hypothetical protein